MCKDLYHKDNFRWAFDHRFRTISSTSRSYTSSGNTAIILVKACPLPCPFKLLLLFPPYACRTLTTRHNNNVEPSNRQANGPRYPVHRAALFQFITIKGANKQDPRQWRTVRVQYLLQCQWWRQRGDVELTTHALATRKISTTLVVLFRSDDDGRRVSPSCRPVPATFASTDPHQSVWLCE